MSHGMRSLAVPVLWVIALGLAGRPAPAGAESPSPVPGTPEERIAALEARIAELEAFLAATLDYGTEAGDAAAKAAGPLALPAVVTRKHFREKDPAHARWEDYVDFDIELDTALLEKPATAIRGTLVFSDAFGEVRFEMPAEVTDRIEPGSPVRHKGLKFSYNQFRDAHQWMNNTDPGKMNVALRISTVMYRDGSTVDYR